MLDICCSSRSAPHHMENNPCAVNVTHPNSFHLRRTWMSWISARSTREHHRKSGSASLIDGSAGGFDDACSGGKSQSSPQTKFQCCNSRQNRRHRAGCPALQRTYTHTRSLPCLPSQSSKTSLDRSLGIPRLTPESPG